MCDFQSTYVCNVVEPVDHEELLGVKLRTKKKKSSEELDAEFAALESKHDGPAPGGDLDLNMEDVPSAFDAHSDPPPPAG